MSIRLIPCSLALLLIVACDAKHPDDTKSTGDAKTDDASKPEGKRKSAGFSAPEGYVAYAADAIDAALASTAIATAETKAWGCSVKYAGDAPSAAAKLGEPAPAFSLPDVEGKTINLADYAGKTVVLEWFNPDCPFVKYAHGEDGPLRTTAKDRGDTVVWLAINSGAPGKQGAGAERNREAKQDYAIEHPILLDEDGAVGRSYGATNTPHLFVIDPAGKLVYAGALDNAPMGKVKG
ncbi:redoxin family protein [Nannocystaceae bacterium ST9]